MKKKKVALLGLTVVAGLSLASCNDKKPEPDPVDGTTIKSPYTTDGGRLDVYINYNAESGVSLRDSEYANAVDGHTYVQGELLPTWKRLAELTKTTIVDASGYAAKNNDDTYTAVSAKNFMSDTDSSQKIDLFMNSTKNINAMGAGGKAVNLLDHLDEMPNFKKFLEENPTIKKQLLQNAGQANEAIYYTPYFDGYQDIERMFVMDTTVAKKVLDATSFANFDTTTNGGSNPAANVVQTAAYTPFIDANSNYPANQELAVVDKAGTGTTKITVKKTDNIIKQQNTLLANGCTGKQLAEQFRTYLTAAYGDYIGSGKLYENYSDIFVGQSAAYNVDELIALMRVVKANPGVITGDATKEVETLFPRGVANNRVDNMADFMQVWGVNGLVSESEGLFFGPDGKLHDAYTTQDAFDGLKNLSAIYDEGLILTNFYYKVDGGTGTQYLDTYFGSKRSDNGYGLLMYDYSASTGAVNDKVDGVGSANTISVQGVRPILPPYTYWATESTWTYDQALTNRTGRTLIRFQGENRTLKDGSWCVPTSSDNISGAVRLMDYLFSEDGSHVQDFGPEAYWSEVSTTLVIGANTPVLSPTTKAMISASNTDFWSFMRRYIGSTHGIGCVRSSGLDLQATNAYAQVGLGYLKNAIALGVVNSSLLDKYADGHYNYDSSVPSAGYRTPTTETQATYEALQLFWASDKCATTANGWVQCVISPVANINNNLVCGTLKVGSGEYTYGQAYGQITTKNKAYLYLKAVSIADSVVPDYAKA